MEKITLQVDGMSCTSCSLGIVKTLESMGLESVKGSYATGEISFRSNSDADLKKAVDTINIMGYKTSSPKDAVSNDMLDSPIKYATTEERNFWFTVPFTSILLLHMVFPNSFLGHPIFQLLVCLPVFFRGISVFGSSAFKSLNFGVPNMDVLIFAGSSAAFAYSLGCTVIFWGTPEIHNYLFYETSASIITLVMLGNLIEHNSTKKTSAAIQDLQELVPLKAMVIEETDGVEKFVEVKSTLLKKGRKIRINEGGQIACDGVVISGQGQVNEAMLTGESGSKRVKIGDTVFAGTILVAGHLIVKAEKNYADSSLASIIDLVKNAQMNPPSIQRIGDKVSAVFVPAVILISIVAFFISFFAFHVDFRDSVIRSIAILVISCPCAMGLATPTAVMVGIGRAAKQGILFRSGEVLEKFAQANVIVFDKTGTLTEGKVEVSEVKLASGIAEGTVLALAKGLSSYSNHPLSKAIQYHSQKSVSVVLENIEELQGKGLAGTDKDGNNYKLGSASFTNQSGGKEDFPVVYLVKNQTLLATFSLRDKLRHGISDTIKFFNKQGFKTILLSGDRAEVCARIAKEAGISEFHPSQSPQSKQAFIKDYASKGKVVMVGDGINDSAALASAWVGISHSDASSIAINTAGVVITGKDFSLKLVESYLLGKATLSTIKQNLFWAFCYNIVAIPLAGLGFLTPMLGTISMAFSDLMVIGNSLLLRGRKLR